VSCEASIDAIVDIICAYVNPAVSVVWPNGHSLIAQVSSESRLAKLGHRYGEEFGGLAARHQESASYFESFSVKVVGCDLKSLRKPEPMEIIRCSTAALLLCFVMAAGAASYSQTTPSQSDQNQPAQQENNKDQQKLPNAPSSSKPSLGDLGFPAEQTQANPQQQALLDKRTHMLKVHQKLGFITLFPLAATVISGAGAGGRSTSTTSRDLHAGLGSATAGLYFSAAYFALRAPKVPDTHTRGQIRIHKALAWVHGPGMVLTPILGAMAFDQKSKGERVHGIAQAHGPVAIVTAGAYGAAFAAVAFKF